MPVSDDEHFGVNGGVKMYRRGGVAHCLEGVAAGGEVLRAVCDEFQLARLDLGAVLLALQVAEFRHQLVGCPVETLGLAVEHVDEAPEQALALVGELGAVGVAPHRIQSVMARGGYGANLPRTYIIHRAACVRELPGGEDQG